MKALVVDDSCATHKTIGGILCKEDFEILEATDGEEAPDLLRNLESDRVNLATIDWDMPVMSGLELVMNIRAEKNLRNTTLIMVITESEHSQIMRTLTADTHKYLIKSFTQEAVSEKFSLLGLDP